MMQLLTTGKSERKLSGDKMEFKKLIDLHTHTDNSPDGTHSTIYMCEQAEFAGIRGIAFTDHCEVDSYEKDHYDRSVMQSYFEVAKARSVFMGRLIVLEGIELGQPAYNPELAEKIISTYDYDIVLGSVHNLRDEQDFFFMDYEDRDVNELFDRYLDALIEMTQWGGFDVLTHLTYPLRYIEGEHGYKIDLKRFSDKIDTILKNLAESGKALEINTSGLRQKIGRTLPTLDYVKRFKEFGGEYITVGSDSHRAEDIGKNLGDGMQTALDAGFKYITLFQSRIPVPIPIE